MPVALPTNDILTYIISASTKVTRRAAFYESDGVTPWPNQYDPSRLTSGSVSVSYGSDVRRALDCEFDNIDGSLNPDPNDGLWYDKIIKIFRGVQLGSTTWECQIGEFMIDRIDRAQFPHTLKVTGRDYVKKCTNSKIAAAETFTSGTEIGQLVSDIAANAGITKMLIPTTSQVTAADFSFDQGTDRWSMMTQITNAYSFELFFDATGYLIMRPYNDPLLSPIDFSFHTGALGNLVSASISTEDSQLFNHILITGESSDSNIPPVSAEAINTEASSPTNVDRIGDRLFKYSSALITTVAQAQTLASSYLKIYAQEQFTIDFSSIVFPWLDVGSIVEVIPSADTVVDSNHPSRFLLNSLTCPLGMDAMTATGKRLTIVSDDGTSQSIQASSAARFVTPASGLAVVPAA